jgi:hypothetical protein
MAAEHGQQFVMLRPEVVAGLDAEAAFGPGQRRLGVVLRGQDGGHRKAVLGRQAGSFRQHNVRAGIALGDVDSTKQSVDLALDERWLRSGVEEALEVAGTCRPPCLVEGRCDVVLNVRPEPILVPRHPPDSRATVSAGSAETACRVVTQRANKLPPNMPKYPLESSTSPAFS